MSMFDFYVQYSFAEEALRSESVAQKMPDLLSGAFYRWRAAKLCELDGHTELDSNGVCAICLVMEEK